MGEGQTGLQPGTRLDAANGRLESWKEIAAYLGRGVTTAQRWEQQEGLPVRRMQHAKKGSVFAYKSEVDAWRESRVLESDAGGDVATTTAELPSAGFKRRRRIRAVAGAALIGVVVAVLVVSSRSWGAKVGSSISTEARVRPLTTDPEFEELPSLSPDGSEAVFHWTRKDASGLYIVPVAGGSPRLLSRGEDSYPKWSPRGDLIAFLRNENPAARGLYVTAPLGGTALRLTSATGTGLAWAADGASVAFVDRNSTSEPLSLFLISVSTGERRRLTTPPMGTFGDLYCAFSPDGRQLAYVRYATTYEADLYVAPADQVASAQRLTSDETAIDGLAWTPDGTSIVFDSYRGGVQRLWKIPSRPSSAIRPVLVAGTEKGGSRPSFSGRGANRPARLVYQYEKRDVNIWRWTDGPGAGALAKVAGSTSWDDHPAFSPDGRRIAFASNRTGANEIWIADADGSNPVQLTFRNGPMTVAPRWSPDGQRLAFTSHQGGNRDIYVINADGSGSQRVTWDASSEGSPSWSWDGRWIYFHSDRSGVPRIWKVPSTGGDAIRVTDGEGVQAFESPDAKTLFFVRSVDMRGLWSVPVAGGTETLVLKGVHEGAWGVASDGIYFVAGESPSASTPISRFAFSSGVTSRITSIPTNFWAKRSGFTVSSDGRSILWTQEDDHRSDLMLLDPWNQ